MFWRANRKAWVTATIFMDWFHNCFVPRVERYLAEQKPCIQGSPALQCSWPPWAPECGSAECRGDLSAAHHHLPDPVVRPRGNFDFQNTLYLPHLSPQFECDGCRPRAHRRAVMEGIQHSSLHRRNQRVAGRGYSHVVETIALLEVVLILARESSECRVRGRRMGGQKCKCTGKSRQRTCLCPQSLACEEQKAHNAEKGSVESPERGLVRGELLDMGAKQ